MRGQYAQFSLNVAKSGTFKRRNGPRLKNHIASNLTIAGHRVLASYGRQPKHVTDAGTPATYTRCAPNGGGQEEH